MNLYIMQPACSLKKRELPQGGDVRTLKKALSLMTILVVPALIMAACGGGDDEAPAATSPAAPTASAPRPTVAPTATPAPVVVPLVRVALSDMRTFGLLGSPGSLRMWTETLYDDMIGSWSDGKLNSDSGLVSSWTVSPDGQTFTLKTRNGVTFHNGDPATARDIKYTIDFNRIPEVGSGDAPQLNSNVETVTATDDNTVVFNLKKRNIFFDITVLSKNNTSGGHVMPQKAIEAVPLDTFRKAPVGSGPFKFKTLNVGQNIAVEAIDNHWYYGVPRVKQIEFHLVKNEESRLALLKTGGAEVVEASRKSSADLKRSNFVLVQDADSFIALLSLHEQSKTFDGKPNPLGNAQVRQALSLAIDRQALIDTFMNGLATATVDEPVGTRSLAYKQHPVPKQDLVQAKALLAQAGYPNGFELDGVITTWAGFPEGPEIQEAVHVWWEGIGIKVNRVPMELSNYIGAWGKQAFPKPTAHVYWNTNRTIPIVSLGQKSSAYRFRDGGMIEQLADEVTSAASIEEYIRIARSFQDTLIAEAGWPALFSGGAIYGAKAGIGAENWNLGTGAKSINIKQFASGKDG